MSFSERVWIGRARQPVEGGAEIRAERDRLAFVLDRLPDGVIAVDESLTVRFVNASACSMLGHGAPRPDLPLPVDAGGIPLRQVASVLFSNPAGAIEHTTEAGTVVSLTGVPAGASKLALLVLTDITKQVQERRSEREFVANASHELRTPVAAIANAVEALEAGAQDDPEARATFIRLIGRQSLRMTSLTKSLLTLARAQARGGVQLAPVALLPLLRDVVVASESATVTIDCAAALGAVAERGVLEQIVSNLLENARRHGGSSGTVLKASRQGNEAVIEVIDAGPGISAAQQERLFDRFSSPSSEARSGFGLGLAIVRDSAEAIGGRVEIDSREGRGTTARVILPAVLLLQSVLP